jgi:hypothetical protein
MLNKDEEAYESYEDNEPEMSLPSYGQRNRPSGFLVFPWGRRSIVETFQGREEAYLRWVNSQSGLKRLEYLKRLLGYKAHRPRRSYKVQRSILKDRKIWT